MDAVVCGYRVGRPIVLEGYVSPWRIDGAGTYLIVDSYTAGRAQIWSDQWGDPPGNNDIPRYSCLYNYPVIYRVGSEQYLWIGVVSTTDVVYVYPVLDPDDCE